MLMRRTTIEDDAKEKTRRPEDEKTRRRGLGRETRTRTDEDEKT